MAKNLNQIKREQGEPTYYTPTDFYPVIFGGGQHDIIINSQYAL